MDQILHRKLINEKNNLEFQVAKANKEVAKLMETVQQYEAVLASLDEADIKNPDIPNKMRLRGDTNENGKPNLPQQSNKPAVAPYKRKPSTGNKPIEEATLVRQAKNRESILKRLGESKKGKEIGEYGSAEERANSANLARLQRKSGIDLGIRGTHREAGSHGGVTPAGEAAEQRRMALQQKTIEKFN